MSMWSHHGAVTWSNICEAVRVEGGCWKSRYHTASQPLHHMSHLFISSIVAYKACTLSSNNYSCFPPRLTVSHSRGWRDLNPAPGVGRGGLDLKKKKVWTPPNKWHHRPLNGIWSGLQVASSSETKVKECWESRLVLPTMSDRWFTIVTVKFHASSQTPARYHQRWWK